MNPSTVKTRQIYVCEQCGSQSPKWVGQCADCHSWNSLVEEIVSTSKRPAMQTRSGGYAGAEPSAVVKLHKVPVQAESRLQTGLEELDRVLGGGLVTGSVVLIGGDPGIGKSTLLLQTLCHLSTAYPTLYITGEESLQQVKLRAQRLELEQGHLNLLAETNVERMLAIAQTQSPQVIVVDSVQTLYSELLSSAPGSVSQVRESAAEWVRYAKQTGAAVFLVGHVTKEGTLAGPRVLEHMVDTVLYFEGQNDERFRMIRAVKNRFGAVNELGIFAMTHNGLRQVSNPSSIFLSRYNSPISGSVVMVTWEGTRPLLVEVQALVNENHYGNPRRVTVGLEQNRLSMLLAVLQRHGGVITYDQDVFLNVVGGVRVTETAADLPQLLSVLSSLKNRPLAADTVVFGEVGLAGEIRPVQSGQERLREAAKHGFKRAIVPKANVAKKLAISGMEVVGVESLQEALEALR
jgi:DNA repair protein RadA/Sms